MAVQIKKFNHFRIYTITLELILHSFMCNALLFFISSSATITTINHDEVWYKRLDGSKSKLYISQLQKGKYTIKHS